MSNLLRVHVYTGRQVAGSPNLCKTIVGNVRMGAEQRRANRYSLKAGQGISAQISCGDEAAIGEVVNISNGGAKLNVDKSFSDNSEVNIRLNCENIDWALELPGKMHWKQPARARSWYVGCSFREAVEQTTIERLAIAGVIERRHEIRQAINIDVRVKLQLSNDYQSARLVDCSSGGFRLWLSSTVQEGQRVVVNVDKSSEDMRTVGSVCWKRPTGDGFFVGCAFVRRDGYASLRKQLGLDPRPILRVVREQMTLAQGMTLVSGVAALLFSLYAYLCM